MREIIFTSAKLKDFSSKTNSLGCIIGTLKFEIESDDPDNDFVGIMELQKHNVKLIIKGEPERTPR